MSMHDSGNEAHQLHDGEQGLTTSPLRTMVRQFLIKIKPILITRKAMAKNHGPCQRMGTA